MSQRIAPGKWNAGLRMQSKKAAVFFGALLVGGGFWLAGKVVDGGGEIGMLTVVLVAVPLALGAATAVPDVTTPIIYRGLELLYRVFGKDLPDWKLPDEEQE